MRRKKETSFLPRLRDIFPNSQIQGIWVAVQPHIHLINIAVLYQNIQFSPLYLRSLETLVVAQEVSYFLHAMTGNTLLCNLQTGEREGGGRFPNKACVIKLNLDATTYDQLILFFLR